MTYSKGKKIVVTKSKIFLFLYIVSIFFVVSIFAFQSGKNISATSSLAKNVSINDTMNNLKASGLIIDNKEENRDTEVKIPDNTNDSLPVEPIYSYEVVSKSDNPKTTFGKKISVIIKIKNTGNVTWFSSGKTMVFLGTSRPNDRETLFYRQNNKGWYSGNRIKMENSLVRPGKIATFTFELTVPEKSGIYREFFTPIIEGVRWLEDKEIYWDVEVRDPQNPDEQLKTTINGGPVKYIKIKLSEQVLYAYDNGIPKYTFQTSTGMQGMDTPTGSFQIYNKFPVQYSAPYELYMDNWMAFTPTGSHGIHSLPYWLYKNGSRVYEGEAHLGTKVSHGCVRVSLENSKLLYDWSEVGTPVYIEN